MPSWTRIWTLLRKELTELFRDKGTLFVNYGIPFLVYPLGAALFGEALMMRLASEKAHGQHVAIVGEAFPALESRLRAIPGIDWARLAPETEWELGVLLAESRRVGPLTDGELSNLHPDGLRRLMKLNKLDTLVVISPGEGAGNFEISLLYDRSEQAAAAIADRMEWEMNRLAREMRESRLRFRGVAPELIAPLQWRESDIAGRSSATAEGIGGSLIPYLLFLFLTLATYYPSLQAVTSERERGTLASLLSTALTPLEALIAKFLLVLFSALSSLLAHATSLLALYALLPQPKPALPHFYQLWLLVPLVVSAAALVAALSVCAATIARTRTEGEGLLAAMMMVALVPVLFVPMANLSLGLGAILVPLLNLTLIFREVAQSPVPVTYGALAIVMNSLMALGLLAFSAQLFGREFLFRGEGGLPELLALNRAAIREPGPALSVLLFFLMLIPSGFASLALSPDHLLVTVPLLQLTLFLGLPLALARYFRFPARDAFFWKRPPLRSALGGVLGGFSLSLLMAFVMSHLPFPASLGEHLGKTLGIHLISPVVAVVVLAILPGICEEVAFRGLILSGLLKRLSPFWAILLTAILFSVNHLSILRLIPTLFAGVLLGYAVWRTRSLPVSMAWHATYNASLLTFAMEPGWFGVVGIYETSTAPLTCGLGVTGLLIALLLLKRENSSPGDGLAIPEEAPRRSAVGQGR